jgi:uncharacterized protein
LHRFPALPNVSFRPRARPWHQPERPDRIRHMRPSRSHPSTANPRTVEPAPAWLTGSGQTVHLALRVQPRASRNAIRRANGAELRVQITAPPVDARANQALIELLAKTLDCPRRDLWIVRGHTSRQKIVAVQGLTPEAIRQRLAAG